MVYWLEPLSVEFARGFSLGTRFPSTSPRWACWVNWRAYTAPVCVGGGGEVALRWEGVLSRWLPPRALSGHLGPGTGMVSLENHLVFIPLSYMFEELPSVSLFNI